MALQDGASVAVYHHLRKKNKTRWHSVTFWMEDWGKVSENCFDLIKKTEVLHGQIVFFLNFVIFKDEFEKCVKNSVDTYLGKTVNILS